MTPSRPTHRPRPMRQQHPKLFTLLGSPVAHSLSPIIHARACEAAGVNGVYAAVRCVEEDLAGLVRGVARSGGGGNVTVPFKERAALIVERPSPAVRRSGACNTFWGDDRGRVHGDNTDVRGVSETARQFCGGTLEGMRVLLLGAGGAARAALMAFVDDRVEEVTIFNRSTDRARAIARRIGGRRARVVQLASQLHGRYFDLVVNATTIGMQDDRQSFLRLRNLGGVGRLLDLVYKNGTTPFVREAMDLGIEASDGREMLVRQAAASFEIWWNQPAPLDAMRAAVGSTE